MSSGSKISSAELVLNKSGSHVDAEVRQRRLDRLHSLPSTSQQSLSPLAEEDVTGKGKLKAARDGREEGEGGGGGGETEV